MRSTCDPGSDDVGEVGGGAKGGWTVVAHLIFLSDQDFLLSTLRVLTSYNILIAASYVIVDSKQS